MPTNDQDARALTHLACRIRADTPGAAKWDDNGTYAVIAELIGQSLTVTCERVIRHASDKDARTPGAIRRPFVPPPPPEAAQRETWDRGDSCSVCSKTRDRCRRDDHEFVSIAEQHHQVQAAAFDTDAIRVALRSEVEPTRSTPSTKPEQQPNPHAEQVRAALRSESE